MTPKDGRSSACSNFHIVFFFQPLSNIKALDQNEEWVSHWTNTAQQLVVSMKNTTSVEVINVINTIYLVRSVTMCTVMAQ